MSQHLVSFINRSESLNTHGRIKNLGGYNADNSLWKVPQGSMIAALEAERYEFFVISGGRAYDLIVAISEDGYKYLRTTSDVEGEPNVLLRLQECP